MPANEASLDFVLIYSLLFFFENGILHFSGHIAHSHIIFCGKGLQIFSVRGQRINIWLCRPCSLSGSYSLLLVWWENSRREYVNEWEWLCPNKTLFIKEGGCPDLTYRLWLVTSVLPKTHTQKEVPGPSGFIPVSEWTHLQCILDFVWWPWAREKEVGFLETLNLLSLLARQPGKLH